MPSTHSHASRRVWNKDQLVGPKLALFDLAIDSKLRGCDLVQLRISDMPGVAWCVAER